MARNLLLALAFALGIGLVPRQAFADPGFSPLPPLPSAPSVPDRSPLFRALGATMLGFDLGSSTWLAAGALSDRDLRSAMVRPLPIGLALSATAVGAGAGALVSTDARRFMRLGIPIGGGVVLGGMVAMFGGGGWYLTCNEPEGPDRDACQRRAGRFFAGSLAIGTALGAATGLVLALSVPPRKNARASATRVYAGPGSFLVKF